MGLDAADIYEIETKTLPGLDPAGRAVHRSATIEGLELKIARNAP